MIRLILPLAILVCILIPKILLAWPGPGTPEILSPVTRPDAIATLRFFFTQVPNGLYPHLQFLTVGNFPLLQVRTQGCPIIEGYGKIGCGINIFEENVIAQQEYPFPDDAPDAGFAVDLFYAVTGHELGHQISQFFGQRWHGEPGPPLDSRDYPVDRGYSLLQHTLINEAGCEPNHYLRSMFPRCYFQDAPQEFLASIANQWFACSECMLRLALKRWDGGIQHPLNQAVMMMVAMSSKPGTTWLSVPLRRGVIHAYHYEYPGVAKHEIWQTTNWTCGMMTTLVGPAFVLTLDLDSQCRVGAVIARDGI